MKRAVVVALSAVTVGAFLAAIGGGYYAIFSHSDEWGGAALISFFVAMFAAALCVMASDL